MDPHGLPPVPKKEFQYMMLVFLVYTLAMWVLCLPR
jgi:hypothetical protein